MSTSTTSVVRSNGIVETLFRHRKKVLLIPALSLAAAALVIFFFPRTYHSQAVLFLQVGRETVGIDPTATTGKTIALQQSGRDDEVKSAMDVLRSRGVAAKTVDRLGPDLVLGNDEELAAEPNLLATIKDATLGQVTGALSNIDPITAREEAIIAIEDSMAVGAERGSTAINIGMEAGTPQLAQKILVELIDVYQLEYARVHRNQDSQGFFKEQREQLEVQLEKAKEAVFNAKNEMGIASVSGQRDTLEGQMRSIELSRYATEQELASATARVAELRQQLANLPNRLATSRKTMPNEGADLLRQQLYDLQIRKADLSARYNENHPLVVAVSHQVDEAVKVVDSQQDEREEVIDDVNPLYQELESKLKSQESTVAGSESRLETLNEQRQLVLQDLKVLNANEVAIDRLEREVRQREQEFFKYAENLEQARIDQALENQKISNISISQEPLLIEKPVSPSKLLALLASMFLATAGTGAAVLASERLNTKIRSEAEMGDLLNLPVFATVPESSLHGRVLVP